MNERLQSELRAYLTDCLRPDTPNTMTYEQLKEEYDSIIVKAALLLSGGNQSQAARLLGVNRGTLRKYKARATERVPG